MMKIMTSTPIAKKKNWQQGEGILVFDSLKEKFKTSFFVNVLNPFTLTWPKSFTQGKCIFIFFTLLTCCRC
jgi:hypothetical protein